MLVIRLARTGKKKQAFFRIVVADKRRAVGAKFIEILGNYNPHAKKLELKEDRLSEYLKNGAQPSNTLAKILKKEGIKMPKWVVIADRNRPPKKTEEAPAAETKKPEESTAPAEAEAEAKTEAKTEEQVTEETESETAPKASEKAEEDGKDEAKAVE